MYKVVNDDGKVVGWVWRGSSCWVAAPNGSQITNIPCDTVIEAAKTVKRLGQVQTAMFQVVE